MSKELVKAMATKFNVTQNTAKEMLKFAMNEIISEAKKDGRCVVTPCIFKKVVRPERKGHNPRTGESIMIPQKERIVMKYAL